MKNTADIARDALAVLDSDGWCKDYLTFSDMSASLYAGNGNPLPWQIGSHCIGGAVNIAMHEDACWDDEHAFYAELAEVIRQQYPEYVPPVSWSGGRVVPVTDVYYIATWNNAKDRTEEEVRRILEKLAAK